MLSNLILLAAILQPGGVKPPGDQQIDNCSVCYALLPVISERRLEPPLAGVPKVAVDIDLSADFPLSQKDVRAAVESRLKAAGIPVVEKFEAGDPVFALRFNGGSVCEKSLNFCAWRIDAAMMEHVFLARSISHETRSYVATTWSGAPRYGYCGADRLSGLKEEFGTAADEFANAYVKANPREAKPATDK